ncbi:hypothetical protein CGGC5_v003956 [Colletotrichum fructicola Nara gc5]|uniref:Uncharacterized protein n=1 Tax=Colletotrichum fructicola (strain Nara gc5) TaxID=1213859 RepID=A0A7J6JDX7_COLFN|nr:hypothetical protein CGGC5_v003956 [Colletotrichum fructicola Nara gc5]
MGLAAIDNAAFHPRQGDCAQLSRPFSRAIRDQQEELTGSRIRASYFANPNPSKPSPVQSSFNPTSLGACFGSPLVTSLWAKDPCLIICQGLSVPLLSDFDVQFCSSVTRTHLWTEFVASTLWSRRPFRYQTQLGPRT